MKSPITSENTGKTPNTSFRESPSFHVLASKAHLHYHCLCPPASLRIHQLASGDMITSCLPPVPSASPPLSPPTSCPVLISPAWLLTKHSQGTVHTHTHTPPSTNTLNTRALPAFHRTPLCLHISQRVLTREGPKRISTEHASTHAPCCAR